MPIWSESIALNGEIGEYITMVRKDIDSDDWYLGSITNEDKRRLDVDLSFLDSNTSYVATIYKDPSNGGWESNPESLEITEKVFNSSDEYTIVLPEGGGQAIRFSPKK